MDVRVPLTAGKPNSLRPPLETKPSLPAASAFSESQGTAGGFARSCGGDASTRFPLVLLPSRGRAGPKTASPLCSAPAGRRLRLTGTSSLGQAPPGPCEPPWAVLRPPSPLGSARPLATTPVVHWARDLFLIHNVQALTGKFCSCTWSTAISKFGPGLKSAFCFPAKFVPGKGY